MTYALKLKFVGVKPEAPADQSRFIIFARKANVTETEITLAQNTQHWSFRGDAGFFSTTCSEHALEEGSGRLELEEGPRRLELSVSCQIRWNNSNPTSMEQATDILAKLGYSINEG